MIREIEEFGQFAESAMVSQLIQIHLQLNKSAILKDKQRRLIYQKHKYFLEEQLNERIKQLDDPKNQWLRKSLIAIKEKYLKSLHTND
ncbi:MAG: hypothetical protein ABUT20_26785 [Bacteroidota bacterium]